MSSKKDGKDLENALKKGDEKEKNQRMAKNSKSKTKNTKDDKIGTKISDDPVELLFN